MLDPRAPLDAETPPDTPASADVGPDSPSTESVSSPRRGEAGRGEPASTSAGEPTPATPGDPAAGATDDRGPLKPAMTDPVAPAPVGRTSAVALAGWVRVIGGAIVFALALRVLAFEAYRIPSTSMEDTLLVGDFVLLSKAHYGPRVGGHRLPGLDDPDRGDVAVFNYPPDLTPDVGRRTPYIKRIVGLPGDTLAIRGKTVYAGDDAVASPRDGRRLWALDGRLPTEDVLDSLGLSGRIQRAGAGVWVASATRAEADALSLADGVESLRPYLRPLGDGSAAFPASARYSLDDYGPVVVPAAGRTIRLEDASWSVVRSVVERFEGHTVERSATGFLVDGRPAETYTFAQDYYFVLGDSRDDSADSRTWGFVPFDHVIGKAVGVYFSWDEDARAVRWERIGKGV